MNAIEIDSNCSPYILDKIKGLDLPALTRKNADFIEAVVTLDSNYGMDGDINSMPDSKFDPFTHIADSKGLYCGSSAFWFNQMQNGGDYKKCLMGAIISIDRINSTHLEATKNGRTKMYEIISGVAGNLSALKNELNKEFSENPSNHLIGLMSVDLPAKGKNGTRSNLSFASKFCSYAAVALGCNKYYSKYDNVVSDHLCDYIYSYLGKKTQKKEIKYDSQKKKMYESEKSKLDYVLSVYSCYSQNIEEIINTLSKEYNIGISKDELDHIIWYGFKGR